MTDKLGKKLPDIHAGNAGAVSPNSLKKRPGKLRSKSVSNQTGDKAAVKPPSRLSRI